MFSKPIQNIEEEETLNSIYKKASIYLHTKAKGITEKLQTSTPYEYKCKSHQQNTCKLNLC